MDYQVIVADIFENETFLRRLSLRRQELSRRLQALNWMEEPVVLPAGRVSCAQALDAFRPLLDTLASEPEEGWLSYTYQTAVSILFPRADLNHTAMQRDAAVCFLQFLRALFDEERRAMPFDPLYDFAFCTKEELKDSGVAEEYRLFLQRFREEYVYEMLRLGQEATPYHTLEHIAGVHHIAMSVARAFKAGGGLIDLGLMSGAAAAHDIGKFGCRPGERVPYLHYYYTDQWCSLRGLNGIGHIGANHSVWDLEIENLSAESLVLVYADFRVKQYIRDGREVTQIYSLKDAFDVILSKLDNVDDTKRKRYQYVYAKLQDFEEYLTLFGVDTTLECENLPPQQRQDAALMTFREVVSSIRHTAVDHNIRLMHRLSHQQLFAGILEAARSEKDPARIRAYVSIFEEYFTYWSAKQKEQTLEFLYELLLLSDGDIRRQAAALMGHILADFLSGYKKELPVDAAPSSQDRRPFELWSEYLERLIHPDRRLTPRQMSMIRYQAKTVTDALLENCADADRPRFVSLLLQHYQEPHAAEPDAAFALLDTVLNIPVSCLSTQDTRHLTYFAAWWLMHGTSVQKAAAMRLFRHLAASLPEDDDLRRYISLTVQKADCSECTPLQFLQTQLCHRLGLDPAVPMERLSSEAAISNVFLDNLKTATPWILKAVGVEYLLEMTEHEGPASLLHIATHFSNLIKVSENIVVRRMAGAALLTIAPRLTPDRRNEIAVELSKALETGQAEIAQYIPYYLGQFFLWLSPRELDEALDQMLYLLSSANANVAAAALSTVGSMVEHYTVYADRFGETQKALDDRRRRMVGVLLKGLSSFQESVRQEALHVLGEVLFASNVLSYEDKTTLFTLVAKKLLFLINEQPEEERTFFYTAAALSDVYRFIVQHRIESGEFCFEARRKAAFFPGTFDPFSLSHKGIVQEIRNLGFEVYLAIDEFSWSKKAQPSLIRRQIVSMSVADEFDVYLFPHDIPVNLATPGDLLRLREIFADRELYLVVGSDVVANASSYRAIPSEGSVHSMNHIVFRRSSDAEGREIHANLSLIQGKVVELQLPTHLEDISSTRIRENIDLGRDISNLIDPTVQDFIYRNSLYLREPQYKKLIQPSDLDFTFVEHPDDTLRRELVAALPGAQLPDVQDSVCILRNVRSRKAVLGFLSMRVINSAALFPTLRDGYLAKIVRSQTAGRILLLTGLYTTGVAAGTVDIAQLLLTEAFSQSMSMDCSYAVWWSPQETPTLLELLQRQGFLPVEAESPQPLLLADMRSPVVLMQNISTTLKEPFSSDPQVLAAVQEAHARFQQAVCAMYPGVLVLSLNTEIIYHRLVHKITALNGVPAEPVTPRMLGPKMCVPFGKLLRGNAVPNTVTKTIHTDKVFSSSNLRDFSISSFPGYAPLESQIRTIRSFRRPIILVDDMLHSGNRLKVLDPLFRKENLDIDRVLVGLLSGRGQDLMTAKGRPVDCVYFVPNMRAWYVESTMYPFIGGDTVANAESPVPGLTPSVNLILPYAFPRFYKECGRESTYNFSRTCLQNSRNILLALENAYRARYTRNLTLSRLSEAIILPLAPDKGGALKYDASLAASVCLDNDLELLQRMRALLD